MMATTPKIHSKKNVGTQPCRMKNIQGWMLWVGVLVFLGSGWTSTAFGNEHLGSHEIRMEDASYFMGPDNENVLVPEGRYSVEKAENWLRLIPSSGTRTETLLIEADAAVHDESLTSPMAMVVPDEEGDVVHLALLQPDGTRQEALGTQSGIRPRGTFRLTRTRLSTVVKMRKSGSSRVRDHRRAKPQPRSVCLSNVPASFNKIPTKVRKRKYFSSTKKYLGARNTLLRKPAYMSGEQVKKGSLPTEHFQGIQRLHGSTRGRYFVITGGLKYGSPTQAQLIVFEMGSQSATGPWALPSYGHNYKKPPKRDRTVKVVNVDSRLWHAGGIQALDYVIGIPIWGDRGGSEVRFYDLFHPRTPRSLPKLTLVRPHTKSNAVALTKLPNGFFMTMVYDDKALEFYHSKSKNIFDGFEKTFTRVKIKEVKGEWESGGGLTLAGKGAYQNVNFLTQCDGTLYLVGMRNKSRIAPITTAADYATLYRVDFPKKDFHKKPTVTKIQRRQFYCYNQQCNFGAGGGMFVLNRHRLFLYAASHWLHDGNKRFNFNEYSY